MPTDTQDPTDQEQDLNEAEAVDTAQQILQQNRTQQAAVAQAQQIAQENQARQQQQREQQQADEQQQRQQQRKNIARDFIEDKIKGKIKRAGEKALERLGRRAAQKIGEQATKAAIRTFVVATWEVWGPVLGALGGILLIIIIVIAAASALSLGDKQNPTDKTSQNPIPGFSMQVTGPDEAPNGQDIVHRINVTYDGPLDVSIIDTIPQHTRFIDASGNNTKATSESGEVESVTWKLNDNKNTAPNYTFIITLKPTDPDVYIINNVTATAAGATFNGPPQNTDSDDFDTLMRGQGRNTSVIGNIDTFTQTVIKNGGQYNMPQKETQIRKIYAGALAKNVNPLAILATWGTEQGFKADQRAFSCPPRVDNGFDEQINCAANTWNNWMNYFDKNKDSNGTITLPSTIGKKCVYDDAFLFAAEKYGPVCSVYDQNDYFHKNFVIYYKKFLGK